MNRSERGLEKGSVKTGEKAPDGLGIERLVVSAGPILSEWITWAGKYVHYYTSYTYTTLYILQLQ